MTPVSPHAVFAFAACVVDANALAFNLIGIQYE